MFDSINEFQVWLIYLLPLASCLLIAAQYVIPAPIRPNPRSLSTLSILLMAGSFLLALQTLGVVMNAAEPGQMVGFGEHRWLSIAAGDIHLDVPIGIRLDGLTAVMLVVVTAVALLVQFYSQGYMAGDPGYPRYYAFLSLFTTSMLGLVLADNMLMLFMHWELVGLCSYLLIGFWFANPARPGYTSPAAAAKKAFIVTRAGDVGFLIAILLIWTRTHTFNILEIQEIAEAHRIPDHIITLFALGVFAGAAGKSAQFPLHTWLPDAMEGPTPVSALIHAATMVAAGVYLVARLFPVYEASEQAMDVVAIIGAITALVAATMGLVMRDLKRVLAYSTISQLGYMMLALGVGGLVAGIFHLMNHAFFKAMLFLGSGSVNHGTNTFDMHKMGGLRRYMPITFATFVIGSLSLAGIPPLSGFWSKDEILVDAWYENKLLFAAALTVAFMTAFYMFRAVFLTFFGEYRGGEPGGGHGGASAHGDESHDAHAQPDGGAHAPAHHAMPHESPLVMWLPLAILAVPSILSGLVNAPFFHHPFGDFILQSVPETLRHEPHPFNWGIAISSSVLAVLGIAFAALLYAGGRVRVPLSLLARPFYVLFSHKYFLDELYERAIVGGILYQGVWRLAAWFDATVVDGAVNGVARFTRGASAIMRRAQTGSEQSYGLMLTGGAALMVLFLFITALR